jgi:hypothetical protein
MQSKLTLAIVAAALLAGTTTAAFAQGKGGGLNRALGASAKAGNARGLGKSSDGLARASGNLARGNMGLNKAAPGFSRAGAARNLPLDGTATPGDEDPSLANQQRILDKRFQQAEHLRGISERNGNERLLGTADRMDASATRNFERRMGTTLPPPPTDGLTPPTDGSTAPPTDGSTTPPTDGSIAPATAPVLEASKLKSKPSGFWFKSR